MKFDYMRVDKHQFEMKFINYIFHVYCHVDKFNN